MVALARSMNATLLIPQLDIRSFGNSIGYSFYGNSIEINKFMGITCRVYPCSDHTKMPLYSILFALLSIIKEYRTNPT